MYKDYYIKDNEIIFSMEDGTMHVAKYNENILNTLKTQNECEDIEKEIIIAANDISNVNNEINKKENNIYKVKGLGIPLISIGILATSALFYPTTMVLMPVTIFCVASSTIALYKELKRENKLIQEINLLKVDLEKLNQKQKSLEQDKLRKNKLLKELKIRNLRYSKNDKEIIHLEKKEELKLLKEQLQAINKVEKINVDSKEEDNSFTRKRVLN
jgi:hypothetical protein